MRKIFQTLLAALTVVATYTACTPEVDDVFEKSSAERIAETLAQDRKILVDAPNGWQTVIYGNTEFGGYNMFLKFNADNTVQVTSEVDTENSSTTHFKLEQSAGAILSFDEYNEFFHFFSDPVNPAKMGTNGKGFEGDLEYRIMSASADSVVLRGKKHNRKMVLLPVADGVNATQYLNEVSRIEEEMTNSRFKVTFGDTLEYSANLSYRNLTVSTITETGDRLDVDCPFAVTTQGYEFYEPVTINGQVLTGFKYVKDQDEYVAFNNEGVKLAKVFPPLTEYLLSDLWAFGKSTMGEFAQPYMNAIAQVEAAMGESLDFLYFGVYKNNFGIIFSSSNYLGTLIFAYKVVADDEIMLQFKEGNGNDNGAWYVNNANFEYLAAPFATKKTIRTFKLTTDNPKNPSWILLTDKDNPNNTIKLYAEDVDPM